MSKSFRVLLTAAAVLLLSAFLRGDDERRHAGEFVLEKLRQQQGVIWQRLGQHFFWSFDIEQHCTLLVLREDREGGHRLRQRIPLGAVMTRWENEDQLTLRCAHGDTCIDYRQLADGKVHEGQLRYSKLPVAHPDDLPKLRDALLELNRLCDDRYRLD